MVSMTQARWFLLSAKMENIKAGFKIEMKTGY